MLEKRMDVDTAMAMITLIGVSILCLAVLVIIICLIIRKITRKEVTHLGVDESDFSRRLEEDHYGQRKEGNEHS